MAWDKPNTKELANFLREQDQLEAGGHSPFDEETDGIAISRLRLCIFLIALFLVLFDVLAFLLRGPSIFENTLLLHGGSIGGLLLMLGVSYIPQVKRNAYAFVFMLCVYLGFHCVLLQYYEQVAWIQTIGKFSVFIVLIGFMMPWGGVAIAGLCIPLFVFFPLCLLIDRNSSLVSVYSFQSNLYLVFLTGLTILSSIIHHTVRKKEYVMKVQFEQENTKLQDTQLRLERAYRRMEKLALLDQLTNAFNRVHMTQWLQDDVYKNPECNQMFSVIMFDIDHFKDVNDIEGHQKGDETLRRIVFMASEKLGGNGLIFRYGGDEFCIMLPATGLMRALKMADAIRHRVAQDPNLFIHKKTTDSIHLSLSLGVTTHHMSGTIDADYLIRWVDAALMDSKRRGRNCISVFDPEIRQVLAAEEWLSRQKG